MHDKADDLPKNDFIKRYGKDGDSVRFATATKMVKKELGIEDYEEGFKSDAQRKAAFASGYKEKGKKKNEGGPGSGPRHKEVTLTRNGKTKTVKGVAAKIFTDAGWKIKEELDDKDKETINLSSNNCKNQLRHTTNRQSNYKKIYKMKSNLMRFIFLIETNHQHLKVLR